MSPRLGNCEHSKIDLLHFCQTERGKKGKLEINLKNMSEAEN